MEMDLDPPAASLGPASISGRDIEMSDSFVDPRNTTHALECSVVGIAGYGDSKKFKTVELLPGHSVICSNRVNCCGDSEFIAFSTRQNRKDEVSYAAAEDVTLEFRVDDETMTIYSRPGQLVMAFLAEEGLAEDTELVESMVSKKTTAAWEVYPQRIEFWNEKEEVMERSLAQSAGGMSYQGSHKRQRQPEQAASPSEKRARC
jgi:hypothetical protein